MINSSQIAEQFRARYARALTDVENGKDKSWERKDSDYGQLSRFIKDLKWAKDIQSLDICISEYLKIYLRYSPADRRSKMAISYLLSSRIDLTPAEDKYLARLSNELKGSAQPFTALRVRFQELENSQQQEIFQLLKDKEGLKNQHASIFDELNEAYATASSGKRGATQQLYLFDPIRDVALEKTFRNLMVQCTQAWNLCEKELSTAHWDQFEKRFKAFVDFLRQNETEKLKLFQILRWCREPLGIPRKVPYRGRSVVVASQGHAIDYLEHEIYFQAVYALLLRAIRVVNPALYQNGFPKAEEEFFLGPLAAYPLYYPNYHHRLRLGIARASSFYGTSTSFLWLLLFGQSRGLTLVNDDKFKEIAELYDAVIKASAKTPQSQPSSNAPQPQGKARHISTYGMSTWEYAKGFFKIGDKLGAGESETQIVYFEGEDTGHPRIFLEFTHMRGPLFEADLSTFLKRHEATPRQLIWEANKGLLVLIAEYFAFLFTMFFPGVGYFGAFLEQGFSGVLMQVVTQEALDQVIEGLSQQNLSISGVGSSLMIWDWLSILTSGRKVGTRLAKKLEREALKQAKADYRLVERKTVPLLSEGEATASHLEERELGNLGLEGRSIDDEDRRLARIPDMIDEERDESLKKLERQEHKALEREEQALEKETHPGDKATKNRGTSKRSVDPYLRKVKERNPPTPTEKVAQEKLATDLQEQCMPDDTSVRVPKTPQTQAGLAQNLASTPKGSSLVFDLDIEIDFPDEIRRQIGRDVRQKGRRWKAGIFGVDGIEFPVAGKKFYYLLEHKEVQTIWAESHFATAKAEEELKKLLEEHLAVGRVLKPCGYAGSMFTTNDKDLYKLLWRLIGELRRSVESKDSMPLWAELSSLR